MKNIIIGVILVLASVCSGRDTNRYNRVEIRQGFEFSQRGGLGLSNEVITAVNLPIVASNLAEGASIVPFSNAVAKVVSGSSLESDPYVSSWARKSGGRDAEKPSYTYSNDVYIVSTNGSISTIRDSVTNSIGVVMFDVSLPWKYDEALRVSTNLVENMTQKQKTELLKAIVNYIRQKEKIPEDL